MSITIPLYVLGFIFGVFVFSAGFICGALCSSDDDYPPEDWK